MEQYISKDALVAEIEKKKIPFKKDIDDGVYPTYLCALMDFEDFINTLEVKEVDLEKELIKWHKEHLKKDGTFIGMSGFYLTNNSQMDIAKHFFELGLSISNSTKVAIPDIDDVLKENSVNPDSKEAKIIKESYFMAIEKLAQKGEKV